MKLLASIIAVVAIAVSTLSFAQQVDPTRVPEEQRSKTGLYLLPKQAPAFIKSQNGKVLFLDVRTRAEAQFLGMADGVEAKVPYVEFQEFMTDWDENRGFYKLEPFSDLAPEVERRLKAKGLGRNDTILLICRSGERSSRAADLLESLGYTKVYTVLNGFEGELSAESRRNINGWKNDGLPWSYELDRKKMYFPR